MHDIYLIQVMVIQKFDIHLCLVVHLFLGPQWSKPYQHKFIQPCRNFGRHSWS